MASLSARLPDPAYPPVAPTRPHPMASSPFLQEEQNTKQGAVLATARQTTGRAHACITVVSAARLVARHPRRELALR